MLRIIAISFVLTSTSFAQVTKQNEGLQEQLVSEFFTLEVATVTKILQ